MNVEYCNSHPIQEKLINLISRHILTVPQTEIAGVYDIFRNRYQGKDYPEDPQKIQLYFKALSALPLLSNFAIRSTDRYIGLDFPSWFNFTEEKPRVMVVGIDPFRQGNIFEDHISVGSPYALHEKPEEKEPKNRKPYRELINQLAQKYAVYVTDTFKVYFCENGDHSRNSYKCPRFTNPVAAHWTEEIHQKIFAEEVEIVKPHLIVTLGAHPVRWFSPCKKEPFSDLKAMSSAL